MKKRNCRRTLEEIEQHEYATKIRKMTDAQIWERDHQQEDSASARCRAVEDFLSDVSTCCKGIGQATIAKLRQYAQANGSII